MGIRFVGLSKSFGEQLVISDVTLELSAGHIHFIVGHSGAGKSVLVRHAIGLLKPDQGEVWVDDFLVSDMNERQLMEVRRHCQMVFQHATLFDSLSLLENIAMPLRKRFRLSRNESQQQAQTYLELVGCAEVGDRIPAEVGAGVQKRVAIARAVAMRPKYILYDEPTTGLDPVAARRTDRLIHRLGQQQEISAVVVSHDMTSVRTIADQVTFIFRQGIYFHGSAEAFFQSADPVIQAFVSAGRVA